MNRSNVCLDATDELPVHGFVLQGERGEVVGGVGAGDDPPTTREESEEALAMIADYLQTM